MSRSEQNVVREMCQAFLHDAVPEYIRDTAYYILSEGGVQKINIQEGETWEAQGRHPGRRPPGLYAQPDFLHHGSQHPPPVQLFGILHQHMPSRGGPGPASAGGTAQGTGRRRRSHAPLPRTGSRASAPSSPQTWSPSPASTTLFSASSRSRAVCWSPSSGAARTSPACPACTTRSRSSRSSTIPTVRVLAPAAACGPSDRPAPGLLRSSCGDPRRSDLVVLLGRAQGILPALEGYRPSLPHREHALCPQAQAQFR